MLSLAKCLRLTSKHKPNQYSTAYKDNLDSEEIQKFDYLAETAWNVFGPLKALHSMNKLRIPFITNSVGKEGGPLCLSGIRALDVGCGAGILAEPLARLGADVIGVDASEAMIKSATEHVIADLGICDRVEYTCEDLDGLEGIFDCIVLSEVIEHISKPSAVFKQCSRLLKPGGSLCVTTINRNYMSWFFTIVAAEYIFNIVPRGTHDYNKYRSPEELELMLTAFGMKVKKLHGMAYNPFTNVWHWTADTSVNYALQVVKHDDIEESTDDLEFTKRVEDDVFRLGKTVE